MEYVYTLTTENMLESLDIYGGEKLKNNQTLVPYNNNLITPVFNFGTQSWEEFGTAEPTIVTPPTPDDILAEKVEETKYKTITEFELRKILSEQQAKTMRMIMMLAKK